jgi:hypothetical protein
MTMDGRYAGVAGTQYPVRGTRYPGALTGDVPFSPNYVAFTTSG